MGWDWGDEGAGRRQVETKDRRKEAKGNNLRNQAHRGD